MFLVRSCLTSEQLAFNGMTCLWLFTKYLPSTVKHADSELQGMSDFALL